MKQAVCVLMLITGISDVIAEEPANDDGFTCAAVMPCDDSGNLFEWATRGPCTEIYRENCQRLALASCRNALANSDSVNETLIAENEELKKAKTRLRKIVLQRR